MHNRLSPAKRQAIIRFGVTRGYIELSPAERESEQIITNKLITTLLYESNRHGWDAAHCAAIREKITALSPDLADKPRPAYESYLSDQETLNGTFYGSYLSDDSDSDEEITFRQKSIAEKNRLLDEGKLFQERGQIDALTYKRKTGNAVKGDLKLDKAPSDLFNLTDRTTIHHGTHINSAKVKRDLDHLNLLLKRGESLEKAIAQLQHEAQKRDETFTSFFVSEYRGVTHLTTKWNKPARAAHRRDPDEIGKRQYSASIYKAAGVNLFRDYATAKQTRLQNPTAFDNPAEELREILLTFREPRPYSYNGYSYSNLAYLLQNIYTQDYYGFHTMISAHPTLSSILLNDANPFFSMGDTPYHANKYAYGLKPYKGHEGDRLRPRWRQDGKAERPYSGVVYTSLHPISDYTSDGPLHLITLNRGAEIKLRDELIIIAERESCFPAYLPEERIIHKHIAKYPSFKGDYKQIYTYKYGLTVTLYNKFKAGFAAAKPHTTANRELKKLLGEWLSSFYETKLIDIARHHAEIKGGILIYRDINGTFSLNPPIDSVNRNTTAITPEIKTPVKNKQTKRAALATRSDQIEPILTEESVSKIIDTIDSGYDSDSESASVNHEGNHTMSLPLSLMLNAIKNQRYRALKRFLTIPEFKETINETFNTDNLLGASLLHFAVARNDAAAIKLLIALPQCHINATADEQCYRNENKINFYEAITPLQLAIMRHCNEAALLLLDHPSTDKNAECAYVSNKDLLSGDMVIEPTNEDDEDFLGMAWYCGEGLPITRTCGVTLSQLALEFDNEAIQDKLIEHADPVNQPIIAKK